MNRSMEQLYYYFCLNKVPMKNKVVPFFLLFSLLTCFGFQCERYDHLNYFTGKLAVAGICSNYTITLEDGTLADSLYEAIWTDPQTSLSYNRAFRLGNPCQFPSSIRAGETFKFVLEPNPSNNCAICQAYYPTPTKTINIRIVN